jgi:uncharacterized protein YdhG (YjbR/CyaY superfamily)
MRKKTKEKVAKKSAASNKPRTRPASRDQGAKAVDKYLAAVPEPARTTLKKLRALLRAAAPREATEALGYGMPTFRYGDAGLAGYAVFAQHCGYFPMSSAVIEKLKTELRSFQTSKGGFRFPVDKPPSATLVKKLIAARLADIERKRLIPRRVPRNRKRRNQQEHP